MKLITSILSLILRLIRVPFDILLLTFHFTKGLLWLISFHFRDLLDLEPGELWPYGCFTEKTKTGMWQCLPGRKYGNRFVFKALCPDLSCHKPHGCHCLGEMDNAFNRWNSPWYQVCGVGLFLFGFWAGAGYYSWVGLKAYIPAERKAEIREFAKSILTTLDPAQEDTAAAHISAFDKTKAADFFELAIKLKSEQKYDEAVLEFRNALRQNVEHADASFQLGECLNNLDRRLEALDAFRYTTKIAPGMWQAHLKLAELGQNTGNWELVLHHAEKTIELNPESINAYLIAGVYYSRISDEGSLKRILDKVSSLPLVSAESLATVAYLYSVISENEEAEKYYRRAISVDRESLLAHVGLANLLSSTGRYDEARKQLDQVRALDDSHVSVRTAYAELYNVTNELDKAIDTYEDLLSLDGVTSDHRLRLAELLEQAGRTEESSELAKEIVKEDSDNLRGNALLARISYRHRLYRTAIEYAEKVLTSNPKHHGALVTLSDSLIALENFQDAIAVNKSILSLKPADLNMLLRQAACYDKLGVKAEAVSLFNQAIELHPDSPFPLIGLGQLYKNYSDSDRAIRYFRKALILSPNDPTALHNLAVILIDTKAGLQEACSIAERLLEAMPNNAAVLNLYGRTLLLTNAFAKAKRMFDFSIKIAPNAPSTHYLLAQALVGLGQTGAAIDQLTHALQFSSNFNEAKDAEILLKQLHEKSISIDVLKSD